MAEYESQVRRWWPSASLCRERASRRVPAGWWCSPPWCSSVPSGRVESSQLLHVPPRCCLPLDSPLHPEAKENKNQPNVTMAESFHLVFFTHWTVYAFSDYTL